ncbi:MAG TPA: hypothetical protein VGB17_02030 [Pyrinomonadaceae bacterium]
MLKVSYLMLPLLLFLFSGSAFGQSTQLPNPIDRISADKSSPNSSQTRLGSPEEEMLMRSEIKSREKARTENLQRAREAAQLGVELRDTYIKHKALSREDWKKLERMEKLARRIRSEAGGSGDDETLKDVPQRLETALERAAEVSEEMRKGVEKTPRQVISMTVIERANELIEIIRLIRAFTR